MMDLAEDVVALLDSLGISKVFLVAADLGVIPASIVAAVHSQRLSGPVTLGIPFFLPGAEAIQLDLITSDFYVTRFREPGRAEAEFGRLDVKTVIRNIYILFSGAEQPIARDDQEIMDLVDPSTPLPPWFSEEDLSVYASLYEKSGFGYPLQVPYRSLHIDSGIRNPKVTCPSLPGMEDFIRKGLVKHVVPDLEIVYLDEGNHFVHEKMPEQVNELLVNFLNKQTS